MRWFLRRLFPPKIPKPKTKYVGIVQGISRIKETDSEYHGYWVLTETGGMRKAESVGDALDSPFATKRRAQVKAWLSGGPLPPLGFDTNSAPPPKPRKTPPKPKAKDNVVAFARKSA